MLLAFHNDQAVKDKYIARVQAHYDADEIIKGKYWENGRGCAVGCTIHGNSHKAYEDELGIPRIIARLEDGIFEGLPNEEAKKFPLRFLNAVNIGADLSGVGDKFMHWMLVDETDGVIRHAKTEKTKKSIQNVGNLYARRIAGEKVEISDWAAAAAAAAADAAYADAAADAAAADADAAADAAAADAAAYAAADDAAAAADDAAAAAYAAAYADAAADAAADARHSARIKQANKLIELIENASIPMKEAA